MGKCDDNTCHEICLDYYAIYKNNIFCKKK